MSLLRLFGSSSAGPRIMPDDVLWGIPLREGFSDDDDPAALGGVLQHAFMIGNDSRAICGFEPPRRASYGGVTRPALGLASDIYNPRCRTCATDVAEG